MKALSQVPNCYFRISPLRNNALSTTTTLVVLTGILLLATLACDMFSILHSLTEMKEMCAKFAIQ